MINLSRPSIRRRDMDAVLSCMVTDSLGPGSLSDQLVSSVAEYLGIAGGIALRERARAFAVAVDLLDLAPGSRVLLDPLVPHAYHAVLLERRLVPVYVDVDDSSLCIDAAKAEALVTAGSTDEGTAGSGEAAPAEAAPAAIVTHTTLGFVPQMEALAELGLPIIEDVSEGIGGNTGEERVGRFGRFVVVGMEPDDVITAGGGTLLLAPGRNDRAALKRIAERLSADALLQDMNAALGLTQIREIEKFIARRAEIAAVFARALMRGRHRSPVQPGDAQNVYLSFPVVVEGSVADVVGYARKKGVEAGSAFAATALGRYGVTARDPSGDVPREPGGDVPREPGGQGPGGQGSAGPPPIAEGESPVARSMVLRCLEFPLYPSLTSKEVATIERVLTTLP